MSKRANHEGTFIKRSDGRWMGKIQLGGQRHTVYGSTRPETKAKVQELVQRYEEGLQVKSTDYTFLEWSSIWLNDYIQLKVRSNTFLKYKNNLEKHISPALGNIPLIKLNMTHVQKLVRQKLDDGLAPATVQIIRNVTFSIVQYAIEAGLLTKNPVKLVVVRNTQNTNIKTLSVEQVNKLISASKEHKFFGALLLLITTGLRRSELCGLKWNDINWEQKNAYIQRAVVRLGGYDYAIQDTKTNSSRRLIPLHEDVLTALKNLYQQKQKSEFIFARDDGQPVNPEKIYKFIHRLGKRCGIDGINVHMLRHTVATLLLQAGENPKIVQELLGHSSITVTMDIYSHTIPGMKEQAVNKLADIIRMGSKDGFKV